MRIFNYFHELGYSEKAAKIWLSLYELGTQPASIVADRSGFERTYVYKVLTDLSRDDLVSVSEKNAVKYFFITDSSVLKRKVDAQQQRYATMKSEFWIVESELAGLRRYETRAPKITVYDGSSGVQTLYGDIIRSIDAHHYLAVSLFASNMLQTRTGQTNTLGRYAEGFFQELQSRTIHVDTYLGNGIALLESLGKAQDIEELKTLPAADSSINIWIVGEVLYIIMFHSVPFAMKIESTELAGVIRFLLESAKVR